MFKFSGSDVRVTAINLLIACRLWPGVAEAVVGPEQRRYVGVLRGQGGVVSDEALDEVLVRRDAGRLRQVLGKNKQTFIKDLFLCPKSQGKHGSIGCCKIQSRQLCCHCNQTESKRVVVFKLIMEKQWYGLVNCRLQ